MSTPIAGALAATPAYIIPTGPDTLVYWDDPGQTWRSVIPQGAVGGGPYVPIAGNVTMTGALSISLPTGGVDASPLTLQTPSNSDNFLRLVGNRTIGLGIKAGGNILLYDYTAPALRLSIDASGNTTIAGTLTINGSYIAGGLYHTFAGAAASGVNTTGGPFIYGDNNWIIPHLGSGNAGFAVENSAGTHIFDVLGGGNINTWGPIFSGAIQSGIGTSGLSPGSTSNSGYLQWYNPNGTRMAYFGWYSGGTLTLQYDNCTSFGINDNGANRRFLVDSNGGITCYGSNSGYYPSYRDGSGNSGCFYGDGGGLHIWQNTNGNRIDMPNDGTVHINGTTYTSDFYSNGNVNTSGRLYCGNGGVNWYNNGGWMQTDQPVRVAGIVPNGNNTQQCGSSNPAAAWSWVTYYNLYNMSQRELKTDISPLTEGALDKIMALRPSRFRWREGAETHRWHLGFILDEVRQAFGDDGGVYHRDFEDGGGEVMAYNELTTALVRAVQELATRLAALETYHA